MSESNRSKILLAKWSDRFIAWLIDFVIISAISTVVIFSSFGNLEYEFEENMFWIENSQYIPTSVIFFIYWAVLESKTGQTIGKKILNLKSTDMYGKTPSLKGILISSFGKSFLLPFDVVLGCVFTNQNRQRIFNRLGGIIVIKIKDVQDVSDTTYLKD